MANARCAIVIRNSTFLRLSLTHGGTKGLILLDPILGYGATGREVGDGLHHEAWRFPPSRQAKLRDSGQRTRPSTPRQDHARQFAAKLG